MVSTDRQARILIEGRIVLGQPGPRHVLYGASRSLRRWTTPYLRGTSILSGIVKLLTNRLISSKVCSLDCKGESLVQLRSLGRPGSRRGFLPKRGYRAVGDPWTPRSTRSFPTGLAVGGFRAARLVEKHQALVLGSEGLGELAGAGPRSSSAGGGPPGNGGSLVDLLYIFSEHRQNRSKTEAVDPDTEYRAVLSTGARPDRFRRYSRAGPPRAPTGDR